MTFVKIQEPMHAQAFGQLFNRYSTNDKATVLTNIFTDELAFNLELAIPGYVREDFNISVEDQLLVIKAEAKEQEVKDEKYLRKEFSASGFQRKYALPKKVDAEGISAGYTNGVLSIKLPFKQEVLIKREISIA
ncbi:MAG: Hsp20/alpha crystallin family protein [Lentimicrobium sp.]|jgi:HSP20 family protein|nr:Hsp20/alpha crystallin family protein [Lentimicrobium sp.]